MRYVLLFALTLVLALSCSDRGANNQTYSEYLLYPLAVGNEWVLADSDAAYIDTLRWYVHSSYIDPQTDVTKFLVNERRLLPWFYSWSSIVYYDGGSVMRDDEVLCGGDVRVGASFGDRRYASHDTVRCKAFAESVWAWEVRDDATRESWWFADSIGLVRYEYRDVVVDSDTVDLDYRLVRYVVE